MEEGRGARPTSEAWPEELKGCGSLHRALCECHRRTRDAWQRDMSCRHLNQALAQCLVATACPEEAEAVRVMCSSAGTSGKRAQCRQAKMNLSVCLSSLQAHLPDAAFVG